VQQEEALNTYTLTVDGFEIARRGRFVVYRMTVSNGQAQWPIRRRFRQVHDLHTSLLEGLGRSAIMDGLPRPPCRLHWRSMVQGPTSRAFLTARVYALQQYFNALLRFIPYVDQCEALYEFLCSLDLHNMTYDALLDLEEAMGRVGDNQPPVDARAIAELPKRVSESSFSFFSPTLVTSRSGLMEDVRCVVCQERLEDDQDIRVLPCNHEYHFECIAKWLTHSNSCCICQRVAVAQCPTDLPEK